MKKPIIMFSVLLGLFGVAACSSNGGSSAQPSLTASVPSSQAAESPAGDTAQQQNSNLSGEQPEKGVYQKITAEQAKQMMEEGGVTVVDVRRNDEYDNGHIPGAKLVPNEVIELQAEELLPDKDAVLLIYCRSGNRSKQAADKLLAMGYQAVYDFGGIIDWPYDIVTGE